ncbi:BCCT family transporter [uncultured Clostridium sp.]|uniref:glycine betaine uptake BCCT transporter n=1 Tax=uncultured Clostridium sp. TaxID=59620 RepID=UPI002610E7BB|nr:BCCT family transporter [uncultured Clostridium sp.]
MVFYISIIFIGIFVLWGLISSNTLSYLATSALHFTTSKFGWLFLIITFTILIFIIWLAMSKYGKLKLGKDTDKPKFNNITWFSMLFSAGMGIGIIFWGVAEPLDHYVFPPLGIEPMTTQAANTGMMYCFFHWGLHAWAIYSFVGLVIAYFKFRKGKKLLVSETITPLFKENFPLKKIIVLIVDILTIIATAFGVATSLGLGALQINGGLNNVFGVPITTFVQIIIIAVATVLFLISSSTGLEKGIKILSNANIAIAVLLLVFVFILGPTAKILELFTNTLGQYFQNIISLSLRLRPFNNSSWIANWTLFYWAWWIAWSPFVGVFIATISKGRTIREFVLGVLLVPTIFSFFWFSVFGGTALNLQMNTSLDLTNLVKNNISSTLFVTLRSLPLGTILSVICIILIMTFFVSSADSATYVLGMFSSNGNVNPKVSTKIIWGILESLIAVSLLMSGGLKGLQTMSILTALPFSIILILMFASFIKALKSEKPLLKTKKKPIPPKEE